MYLDSFDEVIYCLLQNHQPNVSWFTNQLISDVTNQYPDDASEDDRLVKTSLFRKNRKVIYNKKA